MSNTYINSPPAIFVWKNSLGTRLGKHSKLGHSAVAIICNTLMCSFCDTCWIIWLLPTRIVTGNRNRSTTWKLWPLIPHPQKQLSSPKTKNYSFPLFRLLLTPSATSNLQLEVGTLSRQLKLRTINSYACLDLWPMLGASRDCQPLNCIPEPK